jgi:pyruvate dehydrogenase E1 component beta subunit
VRRRGADVTVLAYGWGVRLAERAAGHLAEEGVDAEIVDLRSVDDATVDYETIGTSLRKTGVLVTVEEAQACNGIGPKLVRACEQRWFDYLDAPAACVNASDVPLPVSARLERCCLPDEERVADVIRRAAGRRMG